MALLSCPECHTQVSSEATSCPSCGYPIERYLQALRTQARGAAKVPTEEPPSKQSQPIALKQTDWRTNMILAAALIGIFAFFGSMAFPVIGVLSILTIAAWATYSFRNSQVVTMNRLIGILALLYLFTLSTSIGSSWTGLFLSIALLAANVYYILNKRFAEALRSRIASPSLLKLNVTSGLLVALCSIGIIAQVGGAISSYQYSLLKDSESKKVAEAIQQAERAARSGSYQEALKILEVAQANTHATNTEEAKNKRRAYNAALSSDKAKDVLLSLNNGELKSFASTGRVPAKNYYPDSTQNAIFISYLKTLQPKAESIVLEERKRRDLEKQKAERLAKEAKREQQRIANEQAEAQALLISVGEKPENSLWDGSVSCVKAYFKEVLKDPDSVKYSSWSPVSLIEHKGKKYWSVRVTYRAKNSFGGYVLADQLALIRHNTVIQMIDVN